MIYNRQCITYHIYAASENGGFGSLPSLGGEVEEEEEGRGRERVGEAEGGGGGGV